MINLAFLKSKNWYIFRRLNCGLALSIFVCILLQSISAISQTSSQDSEVEMRYFLSQIDGINFIPFKGKTLSVSLENDRVYLRPFFLRFQHLLNRSNFENTRLINKLDDFDDMTRYLWLLCEQSNEPGDCQDHLQVTMAEMKTQLLEQQSERLLYSIFYTEPENLSEDILSKAIANADTAYTECNLTCDEFYIKKTLLYGSLEQYRDILNKMKEKGDAKNCLKDTLKSLKDQLDDSTWNPFSRMPETCQGLDGSDKTVCEGLQYSFNFLSERIQQMVEDIGVTSNENLQSSCSNSNSMTERLTRILSDLEDVQTCSDYTLGEERRYGRLITFYQVKKEQDDSYTVTIPMQFSASEDYDGSVPENQVNDHFLEKTRECMDEINPNMLGPNGEKLNFVILDGSKLDCKVNKVSIRDSSWRSSVLHYRSDISCQANTHEILHIIPGLNDEYLERSRGQNVHLSNGEVSESVFLPDYNCRVTQTNSIMASHWERFESVHNGRETSLLDPAHFNIILYGNCSKREDVRFYKQCSELAYITEYHENSDEPNCPDIKDKCDRSDILGRNTNK